MFRRIKEWFRYYWTRFKRFCVTVQVVVQVKSPFYPARAYVYIVLFKRHIHEVTNFPVEINKDYRVVLDDVFKVAPMAHLIAVNFPEDWEDTIYKLRVEDRLAEQEKQVNELRK